MTDWRDENLELLVKHYMDQPNEVGLETLAFCNARCTFCPYPTLERKGTKMPDAMIERLVDEMSRFKEPFYFTPLKVNEPLLDKRFLSICELVNDSCPKAAIRIFTNGSALTEDKIVGIGRLRRVIHLWISLNEYRPKEYEELMGIPFERTAERIDVLHGMEFPYPVVLGTVGYPNEEFRHYCYDRWPKFESISTKRVGWIGFTWEQGGDVPDRYCARWFELSVMANGIVALCCQDPGLYPIGDLNKQTLLEVYNDPLWRDRREQMLSRRVVDVCKQCNY